MAGTGDFTETYIKYVKEVILIDVNEGFLKVAYKSQYGKKITAINADVRNIDQVLKYFDLGSIDVVTGRWVTSYLEGVEVYSLCKFFVDRCKIKHSLLLMEPTTDGQEYTGCEADKDCHVDEATQ